MNPFQYGKVVTGKDFCPRAEEALVRSALEDNKIVLINGKPKVGKTSLVRQVLKDFNSTNFVVNVDLNIIDSLGEIERRIVLALMESDVQTMPFKEVLIKYQKYNPSIKVDDTNDDINFSVPLRTGVSSTAIVDVLHTFLKEKDGKYPVLVLDNIQGLFALEEQKEFIPILVDFIGSTRKVRYVLVETVDLYSEKKKSILVDFTNEYTHSVFVDPLPEDKYKAFLTAKFLETANVTLKEEVLPKLLSTAGALTMDRQHLAYALWEVKGEESSLDSLHLNKALRSIFDKYKEFFDVIFEELTPLQRKILKLLAKDKDAKIYSKGFTDKVGPVAGNTIIKTIQALVKRRLIYKDGPYYRFSNPFFREWINRFFND